MSFQKDKGANRFCKELPALYARETQNELSMPMREIELRCRIYDRNLYRFIFNKKLFFQVITQSGVIFYAKQK